MSGISTPTRARVAIGGILHETHTFMEHGTTLADFAAQSLHFGEDLLSSMRDSRAGIGGMIDRATDYKWQLLPTLYAAAMPCGHSHRRRVSQSPEPARDSIGAAHAP